ncbi:MAG: hypothetical protein ACYS5V_01585 [Planctomycetota bacterium]|jgi:hypothetical protein
MNRSIKWIGAVLVGAAVVGWVGTELISAQCGSGSCGAKHGSGVTVPAKACAKAGCKDACKCDGKRAAGKLCRKTLSKQLTAVLAAVESAEKALASGDKTKALASLADAKRLVAEARASLAPPKVGYLNARCPIMGSPIKPAKVTPNLVRKYKGGKVAFCCAGCPAAWDRLTDAERQARLKAAGAS